MRQGMRRFAVSAVLLALVGSACGTGLEELGPPVGEGLLPDLVPMPPSTITTRQEPDGLHIRFTSVLVNQGEGDFIVRAEREDDVWQVNQEIEYSESGGEVIPTEASLVWGGDGHDHWHVARIATYTLVALDDEGNPVAGDLGRTDAKVGFCFYDSLALPNGLGPEGAVWQRDACGQEEDDALRMGLSIGWGDEYISTLPGQSINIEDLPNGMYRLWADADEMAWFTESTRDNNRTWVDLRIFTFDTGQRLAEVVGVGPLPGEGA